MYGHHYLIWSRCTSEKHWTWWLAGNMEQARVAGSKPGSRRISGCTASRVKAVVRASRGGYVHTCPGYLLTYLPTRRSGGRRDAILG
jgi:hypothetical protein